MMNLAQVTQAAEIAAELHRLRDSRKAFRPVPGSNIVHVSVGRITDFPMPAELVVELLDRRCEALENALHALGVDAS